VGHKAVLKPTSVGRYGPKLPLTWQCVDARSAPYLDLELVYGVPGLQGTDRHDWIMERPEKLRNSALNTCDDHIN
jgi:hypothetical protein